MCYTNEIPQTGSLGTEVDVLTVLGSLSSHVVSGEGRALLPLEGRSAVCYKALEWREGTTPSSL